MRSRNRPGRLLHGASLPHERWVGVVSQQLDGKPTTLGAAIATQTRTDCSCHRWHPTTPHCCSQQHQQGAVARNNPGPRQPRGGWDVVGSKPLGRRLLSLVPSLYRRQSQTRGVLSVGAQTATLAILRFPGYGLAPVCDKTQTTEVGVDGIRIVRRGVIRS